MQTINKTQINGCAKCRKNPCVCPDKGNNSKQNTSGDEAMNKENHKRTEPPKISWI